MPAWETLLDLDALAKDEGEDCVWGDCFMAPEVPDRAILHFSRGGKDAVVMREFDLTACCFVKGGFAVPECNGEVVWYGRDTLSPCTPIWNTPLYETPKISKYQLN